MTNQNDYNGNGDGWLGTLVKWVVVGVVALLAFKLVLGVLGIAAFLLFTVAPVVVLGWVLWKAVEAFSRRPERQTG